MMKRMTALLLAALLLFAARPTLAADPYGAWTIELTDIAVTVDGERIDVNPSLVVRVGFTEDLSRGWLTADVIKDGDSLAGFMAEEDESGASRFACTAGQTCGVMDGRGDARFHRVAMLQMGMAQADVPDALSGALAMLDAFLSMPRGVEYLFEQLGSVKKRGANAYDVTVDLPGGQAAATLSWRWDRRVGKPFDLSGRREAPYSAQRGIAGTEGFEEACDELKEALMQDESMEELLIALMLLFEA